MPLRLGRRSLGPLSQPPRRDPALPQQDLGSAARTHRPAPRSAAPATGGTAPRRAARGIQRCRTRTRGAGASTATTARRLHQRPARPVTDQRGLPARARGPGDAGERDRPAAVVGTLDAPHPPGREDHRRSRRERRHPRSACGGGDRVSARRGAGSGITRSVSTLTLPLHYGRHHRLKDRE